MKLSFFYFKVKSPFFSKVKYVFFLKLNYLFTPELAHSSDCVRELELSDQVALCVAAKSWKKEEIIIY